MMLYPLNVKCYSYNSWTITRLSVQKKVLEIIKKSERVTINKEYEEFYVDKVSTGLKALGFLYDIQKQTKNCTTLLSYWFWGLSNLTNSWLWTSMPISRFSQRLRNKFNNSKKFDVSQYPHQQLEPTFLPKNPRQVLAQKALKDAKPRGLLQTAKEDDQRKKPNEKKAQKKKTLNCTERPKTIQILQWQRRRSQKQRMAKLHQLKNNYWTLNLQIPKAQFPWMEKSFQQQCFTRLFCL